VALAEGELQRLAPKIEGRGLTLETSLGLAATTGDAGPIRRLIANLNENAIDHNVEGGRVEIRTESAAALTVSNTGPPIPLEDIDRLFEPFQRLTGRRTADDGHHGLGLSIVRAIAVAHDAELNATPRAGGGLVVTVRF